MILFLRAKFGNMIMVFILHRVPKEHGIIPPFLRWKNLSVVSAEFLYQMMRLWPPLSLVLSIPYFESFESTPLSFVPPEVLDTSLLPEFPLWISLASPMSEGLDNMLQLLLQVSPPLLHLCLLIFPLPSTKVNVQPLTIIWFIIVSYRCLSPTYCAFVSALSFVSMPKAFQDGGRPYLMTCQL